MIFYFPPGAGKDTARAGAALTAADRFAASIKSKPSSLLITTGNSLVKYSPILFVILLKESLL